jgi:hypothetical protein
MLTPWKLDDIAARPNLAATVHTVLEMLQHIRAIESDRAALRELVVRYASECGECEGSGTAPHYADRSTPEGCAEPMFVDCKDCRDVRDLLAKTATK